VCVCRCVCGCAGPHWVALLVHALVSSLHTHTHALRLALHRVQNLCGQGVCVCVQVCVCVCAGVCVGLVCDGGEYKVCVWFTHTQDCTHTHAHAHTHSIP